MQIQTKIIASGQGETTAESYQQQLMQAVSAGVSDVLSQMEESAKQFAPVDTGALRESIQAKLTAEGQGVSAVLFSTAPHARFVEMGTAKSSAQPFLYPAYALHKDSLGARIKEAMP